MRQLVFPAIVLLALGGCCGARFHDRCFHSDCLPCVAGRRMSQSAGSSDRAGFLRRWWRHGGVHHEPAAIPPPNPKYHPVPTRPVFAPLP